MNEGVAVEEPRRGGAVDSRVLCITVGPKEAPGANGATLEREYERAKGDGGGIERSRVIDRRRGPCGSTDMDMCDTTEVARENGSGISAGSNDEGSGSRDIFLAGGTPLTTFLGWIGSTFGSKMDDGGSK